MHFSFRFILLLPTVLSLFFTPALIAMEDPEKIENKSLRKTSTQNRHPFNSSKYTPEQQELANKFLQDFERLMVTSLSPNCAPEDRLQMNQSVPRRADKFIKKAFTNNPSLKSYAERLPQFIIDHFQSRQAEIISIQNLIEMELKGTLSSAQGYAIDYIPENDPNRLIMLSGHFKFNSSLLEAYGLEIQSSRNIVWNFLALDSLNLYFKNTVQKFKNLQNICKIELSTFLQTSTDLHGQAPQILIREELQDIHAEAQLIQLFLPLINLLLNDEQITRALKSDKETGGDKVLLDLKKTKAEFEELLKYITDFQEKFYNKVAPRTITQPTQTSIVKTITLPKQKEKNSKKSRPKTRQEPSQVPPEMRSKNENVKSIQSPLKSEEKNYLRDWIIVGLEVPSTLNLKKLYAQPSEQELKAERKSEAKERKRVEAKQEENKDKETKTDSSSPEDNKQDTGKHGHFILTSNYSLFEDIMKGKYDGEMAPIERFICGQFNGKAYLTDGRWHFIIPHISRTNSAIFGSTFDPHPSENTEEVKLEKNEEMEGGEKIINAKTTIHDPHKSRSNTSHPSKRLRPYHIRALKEMFERGGYTLETVFPAQLNTN